MEKRYILKSMDGVTFEVGNEVISRCGLLRFVTEDLADSMQGEEKPTIPIPRVKSETLRVFIELAQGMSSQPDFCEGLLLEIDIPSLIRIYHAADFLISVDILEMASRALKMRTSEDSLTDLLRKHGSPTRVGHFESILGGLKTLQV